MMAPARTARACNSRKGPLATANTLRLVREHVDDARRNGASVLQAGDEDGQLYPPTILTEVSPTMRLRTRPSPPLL
jgi:acyl-CoA reductase-like NAD-dependent aldehyde dehydrogenase